MNRKPNLSFDVAACAISALVLVLIAPALGRDLNFDFLNYHLYAGLSADGSRLRQDFLGAGIQSYLAPYSYLPLYWLIQSGLPSDTVVIILAALQSIVVVPLWMICSRIGGVGDFGRLWMLGVALATPVLYIELGSTFNDLGCSVFVLFGIALAMPRTAMHEAHKGALCQTVLSGLVTGIGVALKLPLAATGIAIPLIVLVSRWDRFHSVRSRSYLVIAWVLGGTMGFAMTYGYWGGLLWREFGNPFFPFFNGLFQSPLFPSFNIAHERFKAQNLTEFLLRPLAMMEFSRDNYTETSAPDGRPLLYFLSLMTILALAVFALRTKQVRVFRRMSSVALALHGYVIVSWVLWMLSSGNGRYGVALLMMMGLLLGLWTIQLAKPYAITACLVVAVVQTACFVDGMSTTRWTPYASSPRFVGVEIPEDVAQHRAAFISLDQQSASFLAHFVNGKSSFINLIGATPFPPDGPAMARFRDILNTHDRVYAVVPVGLFLLRTGKPFLPANTNQLDSMLVPYGLDLAPGNCAYSKLLDAYPSKFTLTLKSGAIERMAGNHGFWFCPLEMKARMMEVDTAFAKLANATFDSIERRCKIFGPVGSAVTIFPAKDAARRSYVNTDANLVAIKQDNERILIRANAYGAASETDMGSVGIQQPVRSDWLCPVDRVRTVGRSFQ